MDDPSGLKKTVVDVSGTGEPTILSIRCGKKVTRDEVRYAREDNEG
jgi:hypothetical protein